MFSLRKNEEKGYRIRGTPVATLDYSAAYRVPTMNVRTLRFCWAAITRPAGHSIRFLNVSVEWMCRGFPFGSVKLKKLEVVGRPLVMMVTSVGAALPSIAVAATNPMPCGMRPRWMFSQGTFCSFPCLLTLYARTGLYLHPRGVPLVSL